MASERTLWSTPKLYCTNSGGWAIGVTSEVLAFTKNIVMHLRHGYISLYTKMKKNLMILTCPMPKKSMSWLFSIVN